MSTPVIKQFARRTSLDVLMESLDADGGVIVHDFVDRDFLGRFNAELDAHVETTRPGGVHFEDADAVRFWGARTKRFSRLAARTRTFAELLDHELMHAWAARALAQGYWLNTGQAMIVGPGEKAQGLHRDIALWPLFVELAAGAPEAMVSILLALSDFTEEVGATRVVLGSNRWDDFGRIADPNTSVAAVMPAGSALLYLGKTLHGAGANVSAEQWRRGLHMSFVLGWLTPEEASPLGVPWALARHYSPRVQHMLGYGSPPHGPALAPYNWLVDFKDAGLHVRDH